MSAPAQQTYVAQRDNTKTKFEEIFSEIRLRANKIINEERAENTSIQKFHKLVVDHKNKTDNLLVYIRRTAIGAFTVDITACEPWSQSCGIRRSKPVPLFFFVCDPVRPQRLLVERLGVIV